jgi:hypothetical protein
MQKSTKATGAAEINHGKRPRQYATEILLLPKTQWISAMNAAPTEWHSLIKSHIKNFLTKRKMENEKAATNANLLDSNQASSN